MQALIQSSKNGSIWPSQLYQGCELRQYAMVYEGRPRKVLWHLSHEGSVSEADYDALHDWLNTNQPAISPFLKVCEVIVICMQLETCWCFVKSMLDLF